MSSASGSEKIEDFERLHVDVQLLRAQIARIPALSPAADALREELYELEAKLNALAGPGMTPLELGPRQIRETMRNDARDPLLEQPIDRDGD